MSGALDHFLLEPIRLRHFGLWKFRIAQLLHERTNGRFDQFYTDISRKLRPPKSLGMPLFVSETVIDATVKELWQDGCSVLPQRLDQGTIDAITDFAFSTPAYAIDPAKRIPVKPGAFPTDRARHIWSGPEILGLPAVQKLALDPAFSAIAQAYLKAQPVLSSVSLWVDAPSVNKFGAHQYHYDNDGPGFLKFFFYLTDVEADSGAHCFLKGTHPHTKPEPFKISKIYDDKVLHDYFGKDKEVMFTAPKGTIIAEDTAGFHRGSTVTRNHRLLMQFQFSVLDIPTEEEMKGGMKAVLVPHVPDALKPIVGKLLRSKS